MRIGFLFLKTLIQENNTTLVIDAWFIWDIYEKVYLAALCWSYVKLDQDPNKHNKDTLVPLVKVGLSPSSPYINRFKRPGFALSCAF